MSLEKFRAQHYSPIRLQASDLATFFSNLKQRKLTQKAGAETVKVTDKPFQSKPGVQRDAGVSAPRKKHIVSKVAKPTPGKKKPATKRSVESSGSSTNTKDDSKPKKTKRKSKLEPSLQEASV